MTRNSRCDYFSPSLVSTLLPSPLPSLFHPSCQLFFSSSLSLPYLVSTLLPSLFHPLCQLYSIPLFLISSIPRVNFTPFPSSFSLLSLVSTFLLPFLISSISRVNFTPFFSSFSLPSFVSNLLPFPHSPLPSLFHPWSQLYSLPLFVLPSYFL